MKIFLAIFFTLIACAIAEEWTIKSPQQWKTIYDECLKKHPLSDVQLEKVETFKSSNEEAIRQFVFCKSLKLGIYDTEHGFHVDRIAKQLSPKLNEIEVKKAVEDCIAKCNTANKSEEVFVYEVHNCSGNKIFVR